VEWRGDCHRRRLAGIMGRGAHAASEIAVEIGLGTERELVA